MKIKIEPQLSSIANIKIKNPETPLFALVTPWPHAMEAVKNEQVGNIRAIQTVGKKRF